MAGVAGPGGAAGAAERAGAGDGQEEGQGGERPDGFAAPRAGGERPDGSKAIPLAGTAAGRLLQTFPQRRQEARLQEGQRVPLLAQRRVPVEVGPTAGGAGAANVGRLRARQVQGQGVDLEALV